MGLWIEMQTYASVDKMATGQPLRWGCGLKYASGRQNQDAVVSASAMGLWIEIIISPGCFRHIRRQPLRWGCGLKYQDRGRCDRPEDVSLCDGAVD